MAHRRPGQSAPIGAFLILTASCVPAAPHVRPANVADSAVAAPRPEDLPLIRASAPAPAAAPAVPASEAAVAAPFHLPTNDAEQAERATDCLAAAIYYEARSEGEAGQRAVAQVVLNRVRHRDYPATICGVVFQHGPGRACQFSFTCDGSMRARREPHAWAEARRIAREALAGAVYAPVGRSTHYHTRAVSPGWGRRLPLVTMIGAHIFYDGGGGQALRPAVGFAARMPAPPAEARPAVRIAGSGARPPRGRADPGPSPRLALRDPLAAPGFDFSEEDLAALPAMSPSGAGDAPGNPGGAAAPVTPAATN